MDTPNSDWGPDCVWCQIFSIHHFGKIPCLRSNHYGLIHMDTRSLTGGQKWKLAKKEDAHSKALKLYKQKMESLYKGRFVGKIDCRPHNIRYIGSEAFV